MWLVYLLLFVLPVVLVGLVIGSIAAAGARTYRNGIRAYQDVRPFISDLKSRAEKAQKMGLDFADRGGKLAKTFEEIGGRWAFITEFFQETAKSPLVRIAGLAGRFSGGRGD